MARHPLSDDLRLLSYQAMALEDQLAAGEEFLRRADLFYAETEDGFLIRPYPWDLWEQWALEDGVSPPLAEIGAAVMYLAHLYEWPDELREECGWHDCGRNMIALAQQDPEWARIRWSHLLQAGGDAL